MTAKFVTTGAVAIAAISAAAAGPASMASVGPIQPPMEHRSFGVPLPLDPAADVPSAAQLLAVLNGLQDPSVPFANKGNLVEGGISPIEARIADVRLQQAVARGQVPLTINLANIHPAAPNTATADVTISSPKLAPTTRNVTFVNQGGWKISHASALGVLQEAGGG